MALLKHPDGYEIEYTEEIEGHSPVETFTRTGGARVVRRFKIHNWQLRWAFVRAMLGWSSIRKRPEIANGLGDYVTRVLPVAHPVYVYRKRNKWMYAVDLLRMSGRGKPSWDAVDQAGAWEFALAEIAFESVPYGVRSDGEIFNPARLSPDESLLKRFTNRQMQPAGEFLTLPRGALRWVSDNAPSDQTPGKIIARFDVVYSWHSVPAPTKAIFDMLGKVNETEFDGHAAETLMLTAAELIPKRQITGWRSYDINLRCRYVKPEGPFFVAAVNPGHNWFLRFKKDIEPKYDKLYTGPPPGVAAADTGVLKRGDFSNMFFGPFLNHWVDF